jgi:hypothetical protein
MNNPFAGGKITRGHTLKHRPLIWENMLGTVYACHHGTADEAVYFDYDYAAARKHAGVDECTDLRICKSNRGWQGGPRKGQVVFFGIPPEVSKKD